LNRRYPVETLAAVLGKTPLLQSCSQDALLELASGAEHQAFQKDAVLQKSGSKTNRVGLLLSGRAALLQVDAATGNSTRLEVLRPGDLFGETELLLGSASPLSVVAEVEGETLTLSSESFEAVLGRSPDLTMSLARRMASRFIQRSLMGALSSGSATVQAAPPTAPAESSRGSDDLIEWVDLGLYSLSPETLSLVPPQLIRKHRLLPLELNGKTLTVGMVNPRSTEALQELRRVLHTVDPKVVAISGDDFATAFVRYKLGGGGPDRPKQRDGTTRGLRVIYAAEQEKTVDAGQAVVGSEVIALFDRILLEAVDLGASDIHLEQERNGVAVKYRVQGALVPRKDYVAATFAGPLLARIKVLAELDITEHRLPQDGRILAQVGPQELNLRVSTMNVARGEKAVIRIIDAEDAMRPLHQIFANPNLEKTIRANLAEPYGAIVVAGPTGSGKSSTLYSMLMERRLARQDTNIVTVEDPIEYLLQGITQVPVNPRSGFDFSTALRGLMRQDPDVIMIGELRDAATTAMMIEAALTGHLVMTSIHGNHATAVLQRLQHLGTDAILLSQALSTIVVQRLARKLCPSCVTEGEVAPALFDNLVSRKVISRAGTSSLPHPKGCSACKGEGFLGRVAVQEVLVLDDGVRGALADNAKPEELIVLARKRKCFTSFAESAAYLMARRLLSPADALLVVAE